VRLELVDGVAQGVVGLADRFVPFSAAIDAFRASVRAGAPDVRAFREAIGEIANTDPENAALQATAAELFGLTGEADEAARALSSAEGAVRSMGAAASGELAAVKEFGDALRELSGIALPRLDDRARAAEAFNRALRSASGTEERQLVFAAYEQSLERIGVAEAEAASKRTETSRVTRQTLQADRREVDMLRTAQGAVVAQWDEMRSVASGVFSSIASDIRSGASAGEILLHVVNRIADSLIRAGASGFESLLFGARGGAPAGLFGVAAPNLFSVPASVGLYHQGGDVGAHPPMRRTVPASLFVGAPRLHTGLRSGEFPAILEEGEQVIPRGGSGTGVINNFYVSTPSPRAFAESRATVARAAGRLVARSGRHT
jgi:hypothetical protein